MQVLRNGRGLGAPPQDLVKGANGMLGSSAIQDDSFPYWWTVPHSNVQHVQRVVSIPAPPNAVSTEIAAVTVPSGFVFVLRAILQGFSTSTGGASPWVEGSGDILWTVDVDTPTGGVPLSGYPLPDLSNMAQSRGSTIFGPWYIEGYNVFLPFEVIRIKAITTAAIAPGSPNFITGGLFGWYEKLLK